MREMAEEEKCDEYGSRYNADTLDAAFTRLGVSVFSSEHGRNIPFVAAEIYAEAAEAERKAAVLAARAKAKARPSANDRAAEAAEREERLREREAEAAKRKAAAKEKAEAKAKHDAKITERWRRAFREESALRARSKGLCPRCKF